MNCRVIAGGKVDDERVQLRVGLRRLSFPRVAFALVLVAGGLQVHQTLVLERVALLYLLQLAGRDRRGFRLPGAMLGIERFAGLCDGGGMLLLSAEHAAKTLRSFRLDEY